jgi:diamine N-acetyltransferase
MLEWMKDPDITRQFRADFSNSTFDSVLKFVETAQDFTYSRHYAIVNELNEYLGTISLKNIDTSNLKAEYAIVLRKIAQGTHVAQDASKAILDIAFNELHLHKVYLNVLTQNTRANRFYQKFGFKLEGTFRDDIKIENEFYSLNWYSILKESYESLDQSN